MFHNIPEPILACMRELEARDAADRTDGTPRMKRLRQIPPETGKFIALLAASAPPGSAIEIGTSAGYSALWLALAIRENGRKLITFEVLGEKAELARETFRMAGVEDCVELVIGDARDFLPNYKEIAFCFLDAEKEVYADCIEMVIPNMVKGGWLIADNAINHRDILLPVLEWTQNDPRLDALIVPIGKGELVCRKR